MQNQSQPVELWAIIELFGHQKMAGKISEHVLAGNFIRIDVPATTRQPAYSRMVNPSAIYAINPVSETIAQAMAEQYQTKPLETWDIQEMYKRLQASLPAHKASGEYYVDSED
ncbi:hypothetical protein [Fibrella forsythiae]|uniref:Acetyltransferase n=1 Tax=Fibrella forsythiae TaxID=2817061 RepID=A0ABS3JLM3_9BACT|nr:hypothetical protein [Fibrella forsythiae]MBO0950900.1 hypothetical protein [Fibrella forsythiae]